MSSKFCSNESIVEAICAAVLSVSVRRFACGFRAPRGSYLLDVHTLERVVHPAYDGLHSSRDLVRPDGRIKPRSDGIDARRELKVRQRLRFVPYRVLRV